MRHITKELLKDCSTPVSFRFSMSCSECGKEWNSTPVIFSKAGIVPETEGKKVIFDALYQREKETALDKALEEASNAFNQCPICRRPVCDYCFLICDDLDLCAACATRLQEPGEPVMQYA
ncbi:MAG: hypothetical protein J6J43_01920 [Oscillospiraceae bacterium]|nr:hypothetical protein [Oscillospiraceae bacterium]